MKKSYIAIIVGIFLLVILFMSGLAYVLSGQTVKAPDAVETQAETQSKVRDEISVGIYVPTKYDGKSGASYYIILKNMSDKNYRGAFELEGVETPRGSDKVGKLSMYPSEVRLIPGAGNVPKDAAGITLNLRGDFKRNAYKRDGNLEYAITREEDKGIMTIMHVYMPPGASDATYISASKEIQNNLSNINKIFVVNFSPIMLNPAFEQVWVRARINKVIGKNDILFYTTDESNNAVSSNQTERRSLEL